VAYFVTFAAAGLLRWLVPTRSPLGPEPELRAQLIKLNVMFWVLILAAAVIQRPVPNAVAAPFIVGRQIRSLPYVVLCLASPACAWVTSSPNHGQKVDTR
jgi:hypothetical protein